MTQPFANPYEAWVRTVRAWVVDESVSLAELPVLTDQSLPMDAFNRLQNHLGVAVRDTADAWVADVNRLIGNLPEHAEFARRLVALRRSLARRLELARHPGLPEQIRRALDAGTERFVRGSQRDIERAIDRLRLSVPDAVADQYLRTARENSFTAVLGYVTGSAGKYVPDHQPAESGPPAPVERPRRRIMFD